MTPKEVVASEKENDAKVVDFKFMDFDRDMAAFFSPDWKSWAKATLKASTVSMI